MKKEVICHEFQCVKKVYLLCKAGVGHKLLCVSSRFLPCACSPGMSMSCDHAKAAVILQPAAEAEQHRSFIMASFITPGTAWHHSQDPFISSQLPLTSLLSLQLQRSLVHVLLYLLQFVSDILLRLSLYPYNSPVFFFAYFCLTFTSCPHIFLINSL